MTKQEQYNLRFRKTTDNNKVDFYCEMSQRNDESLALSERLNYLGKYSNGLIDEIIEDFDPPFKIGITDRTLSNYIDAGITNVKQGYNPF